MAANGISHEKGWHTNADRNGGSGKTMANFVYILPCNDAIRESGVVPVPERFGVLALQLAPFQWLEHSRVDERRCNAGKPFRINVYHHSKVARIV